jgi:hypothetical protein
MLGFWCVVRELKNIARSLSSDVAATPRARLPAIPIAARRDQPADHDGSPFGGGQPILDSADNAEPAAPPPWQGEAAARDRGRSLAPPEPEPVPVVKQRRNLMFSSSSRKERERAEGRPSDFSAADSRTPPAPPFQPNEAPETFDDAWPQPDRAKTADTPPPPRRTVRSPSTFTETGADRHPPAARKEEPSVTILKSGVVDGMAYSLYSDGSIEAQMPEGMMRFASIEELRAHLDQRP